MELTVKIEKQALKQFGKHPVTREMYRACEVLDEFRGASQRGCEGYREAAPSLDALDAALDE